MGLEIRRNASGTITGHWYGAFTDGNGRRVCLPLKTKIADTPPASLRETGSAAFEASRAAALAELESLKTEARHKGRAEHLVERLIEAKTGKRVEYVRLADLPDKWRRLGRETQPTDAWLEWCDVVFKRFAEAVPCEYLHEVTQEQAAEYVGSLRAGFTRRTANGAASLLKSAFMRLLPPGASNPFGNEIARRGEDGDGDTIHRRPLTATELAELFQTARPDPLLYPLTVCAACTGLRIGDVCLLRWQSVDLRAGVVMVKTSKTGKAVEIPIFEPLREVLEAALADKGGSPYVWPDAARMYKANRYGITYRGKALFARAFAGSPEGGPDGPAPALDKTALAETCPAVAEAVRGAGFAPAKRDRLLDTLRRYADGRSYRQIEAETGRCRGQVSQDLQEAERVSGVKLRQGATEASGRDLKTLIAATRQRRGAGNGVLSASLLGWHALRGTWATLALSAGIPVETVKLVTGHGTTNTVLKFYYNPQRDHLRAVLGDKLPAVLTGAKPGKSKRIAPTAPDVAELAEQLKTLSAGDRRKLAKLLNQEGK